MELSNGVSSVYGKFSGKGWLTDKNGNRITVKHKQFLHDGCQVGPYIPVYAGWGGVHGAYLFHEKSDNILIKSRCGMDITKISESLYSIYYRNEKDSQYDIYDNVGKLVIGGLDDISSSTACGLIAAKKGDKWGYINEKGDWVIQPIWLWALPFTNDGYAVVQFRGEKSKYSIISELGTYMCNAIECDFLIPITDTTFLIKKDKKRAVIDEKGKVIIPYNLYSEIMAVGDYYKVKSYQGTYGLYDNTGKEIFECIYPRIIEMEEKFMVQDVGKKEHIKTVPKQKQN